MIQNTRFLICDEDAPRGMFEPRAHMVPSLRRPPDAPAWIRSCAPTVQNLMERSTTCRDGVELDDGDTPARRPEESPDGARHEEHRRTGLARLAREVIGRGRGGATLFWQ